MTDDEVLQLREDTAVGEDTLHGDAGLTGLPDPEGRNAFGRVLQVSGTAPVRADNDGGVATQLEGDVLAGDEVASCS